MTAPNIFDRAIDLLNTKGWCRGTYVNHVTGAICAKQAIREAGSPGSNEAYHALLWLERRLRIGVPTFNDMPGRTKAGVIEMLADASAKWNEGGIEVESITTTVSELDGLMKVLDAYIAKVGSSSFSYALGGTIESDKVLASV